jgi:hypothetical protein
MINLTQEAKKDRCMHVVLLEQVIDDMTSVITVAFRDIALILKPAAYHTMESIITCKEPQSLRMKLFRQKKNLWPQSLAQQTKGSP